MSVVGKSGMAVLLLFAAWPLGATDTSLAERKRPLDVPRSNAAVTIDGALEDAWRRARRVTLPYESWPAENIPARAETEAFIMHDDDNLYVAFIAHDPEPAKIRAHLSDRDRIFEDDFVGVILDTFNDERRGFEFFVNPLGVQGDLFRDDINGGEDATYDAIWESEGRITDEGYVVEMAIPFRSLRFRSGGEAQVWGIEFARTYPRGERHQFRAYKADRNLACYLCEFQKYRGFGGVSSGNHVELTPTVTAFRTNERPEYREPFEGGGTDVEPGLDVSWALTPNVIFNATLNPDFSQVEADSALLDVNNQFALFFDERRPFFLEGQDLFDDAFDLVYTRNVSDPDYGAKITGKEGSHAFGAFVTDDKLTNLIFPGAESNEFESFDFESRNAAARYRYDLGTNSAVGALVTKREGGAYSNRVYAVDALYRMGDSDRIVAEVAQARTEYPAGIAVDYEQPEGVLRDRAWHIDYERNVRDYFLYLDYTDIGEDFRADLGFRPQVGYRSATGGGGYNWFGENDAWYRRLRLSGEYDFTFASDGQELEREAEIYFIFTGRMQAYVEPGLIRRRQYFDGTTYYQTLRHFYAELKPSGSVALGGTLREGDAIDYANSQAARVFQFEPWMNLRLGRHLALDLNYRYQELDVASGRLFTARISELRGTWQFNTRLAVRWIAQHRDVERDANLYVDEDVDARSREWVNQLLLSYKINPRTLVYTGYSDGHESVDNDPLQQQVRTVFVKLSYAWQL